MLERKKHMRDRWLRVTLLALALSGGGLVGCDDGGGDDDEADMMGGEGEGEGEGEGRGRR
jgi:hypothetical protein